MDWLALYVELIAFTEAYSRNSGEAGQQAFLSPAEAAAVRNLAMQAAHKIAARWVAIDIGQAETGQWWVIEMGDAQFSGFGQISALQLFGELGRRLKE